jgi:glycosyltransferase involved in cell wall biosynthesis
VRVAVVSGIWPPDAGGPASHAPALADFLVSRGIEVEVVTTADVAPKPASYRVTWVSRRFPPGVRHALAALVIARRAATCDVVYATSMLRRAALGAALVHRPLVVKLTTDEVFERQRRSGRYAGTIEEFQRVGGGLRVALLRWTRDRMFRRACHVFVPSAYLRRIALGWGLDPDRVSVLPNPAPNLPALRSRDELRGELGMDGCIVAFAGRLAAPKALDVALDAIAHCDGVTFVLAGDGPERARLEARARKLELGPRARFLGGTSRGDVLRLFRAADLALLSSAWENFPHTVVEALAVGCPVIATAVGGVPEIVRDGENGLLVPPNDADALAEAINRFFADGELRRRLTEAAPRSVAAYTEEAVFTRIEEELMRATRR